MGKSKNKGANKGGAGRGKGPQQQLKLFLSKQQTEDNSVFLKRSREIRQEGNRHFSRGRFEHARLSYEKALQLCEGEPKEAAGLHSNLGAIFIVQHKFEDAIRECTLALEIDPYQPRPRQRRARAFELTGNLLGALTDVRYLMKVFPKDNEALLDFEKRVVEQLKSVSGTRRQAREEKAEEDRKAGSVSIKLEKGKEVRLVEVNKNVNYAQLKASALEKFPSLAHFNVKAKDNDGDEITLSCADDIRLAMKVNQTPKFIVVEVEESDVTLPAKKELDSTKVPHDFSEDINLDQQFEKRDQQQPEEQVYELDDWMIDFAELFKEHLGVDIDTPLDLSKIAWEKCAQALDEAVHNSKSEKLLRQAANKFEEVILTALVNLGNVYMCIARRYIDEKNNAEADESSLEAITNADKELDLAEQTYKAALERKSDFADAILSLGQLEFEKGKISMSFGVPEGHKYHFNEAEGHFLASIDFFKESLDLLPAATEEDTEVDAKKAEEKEKNASSEEENNVAHDANLDAQAQVMWGNALYELSQCYATAEKEWKPMLGRAIEKFKDAKCKSDEVNNALQMHCKADEIDKDAYMKDFGKDKELEK